MSPKPSLGQLLPAVRAVFDCVKRGHTLVVELYLLGGEQWWSAPAIL